MSAQQKLRDAARHSWEPLSQLGSRAGVRGQELRFAAIALSQSGALEMRHEKGHPVFVRAAGKDARPWTYRGVRIVRDGGYWDATRDTGAPLRAQSKQKIREQIDAHLAEIEARKREVLEEREALIENLERQWGVA